MSNNTYKVDRKHLKELFGQKSDWKGLSAIGTNWICFVITILIISRFTAFNSAVQLIVYLQVSFLAACCLRGFDNLTHEGSHRNIFKTQSLHDWLEFTFSYLVFKTLADYGPPHFKHHKGYRIDKDNDPDTQQNIRWGVEGRSTPVTWVTIAWFYFGRVVCLYYVVDHIRYNIAPHLLSKHSLWQRLLFWAVVLTIVTITNSWVLFLLAYVVPAIFWLPFIRFITESSKHTNVNLEEDFANSRNNIGLIHELLLHPHGDGFHQLHHYAASIPFYNLKKAYRYASQNPEVKKQMVVSTGIIETIKQEFKIK